MDNIQSIQEKIEVLKSEITSHQFSLQLSEASVGERKALADAAYKTYCQLRDSFTDAQDQVKSLNDKITAKNNEKNSLQLEIADLLASQQAIEDLAEMFSELDQLFAGLKAWNEFLAPFQKEDTLSLVNCFRSGYRGFLNANDMGLGKTVEAAIALLWLIIEFVKKYGRRPFILWSTRKQLIASSFREIHSHAPELRFMPLTGVTATKEVMFDMALDAGMDGVITNYETANSIAKLRNFKFDIVVIDEVHKLKGGASSKPTQVWLNYKNICANAEFLMFLSGTPMVNKASEMWAYLHIFDPVKFDDFNRFERTFGIFDAGTMTYKINATELMKSALKGQMISRKKSEVGIQLPELTREVRMLTMDDEQAALYKMLMKEFQLWCSKNMQDGKLSVTSVLAQLTRQRQVLSYPAGIKYTDPDSGVTKMIDFHESIKIDETMDLITQLSDAGESVVVASTFNAPLYRVQELCEKAGIKARVLCGDNTDEASTMERGFQNDDFQVFLINSAVGEGLNLQKDPRWNGGAAAVILIDLWYSPARNEQVEARVHRMGAFDNVTSYILQVEDSVDAFIVDILEEKSAAFESVLEKQELRPMSELKAKYPNIFGEA